MKRMVISFDSKFKQDAKGVLFLAELCRDSIPYELI